MTDMRLGANPALITSIDPNRIGFRRRPGVPLPLFHLQPCIGIDQLCRWSNDHGSLLALASKPVEAEEPVKADSRVSGSPQGWP